MSSATEGLGDLLRLEFKIFTSHTVLPRKPLEDFQTKMREPTKKEKEMVSNTEGRLKLSRMAKERRFLKDPKIKK